MSCNNFYYMLFAQVWKDFGSVLAKSPVMDVTYQQEVKSMVGFQEWCVDNKCSFFETKIFILDGSGEGRFSSEWQRTC